MRARRIAFLALLVLLCAGTGTAWGVTIKAKAPVFVGSSSCGETRFGPPGIGDVTFYRTGNAEHPGNEMALKVKTFNGRRKTLYEVQLFGDGCVYLGSAGTFTTNKSGGGKLKGTVEIPEADGNFFVNVEAFLPEMMSEEDESPSVYLKCTELSKKCR